MKKIWLLILIVFSTNLIWAGKLDEFERDIKKQPSNEQEEDRDDDDDSSSSNGCGSAFGEAFGRACMELYFELMLYGGIYSFHRGKGTKQVIEDDGTSYTVVPRKKGDPLIPNVQVLSDIHSAGEGVFALTNRAEVGIGFIAVVYKGRIYMEIPDLDALHYNGFQMLYRMSFGDHVEVDLGGGIFVFRGNMQFSAPWFSMPIRIYPIENFGIEFAPSFIGETAITTSLSEGEVMLVYTPGFISIRAGYSWFGNDVNMLGGPAFGISFQL